MQLKCHRAKLEKMPRSGAQALVQARSFKEGLVGYQFCDLFFFKLWSVKVKVISIVTWSNITSYRIIILRFHSDVEYPNTFSSFELQKARLGRKSWRDIGVENACLHMLRYQIIHNHFTKRLTKNYYYHSCLLNVLRVLTISYMLFIMLGFWIEVHK